LARRQLETLRKESEKYAAEQTSLIEERLDAADALRSSDSERAAAMYRAVVTLYAEKPWAAAAVRRARDALKQEAKKPSKPSDKTDKIDKIDNKKKAPLPEG